MILALVLLVSALPWSTVARSSYELEATYDVALHLDWVGGRVHVETRIDLVNTSGGQIDRIVLNSVAGPLGAMRNLKARIDGATTKPTVSGQTISLKLKTPLAVDDTVSVWVGYRARLATSNVGRNFLFAKLDGVAQLYRFIPWISRRIPFGKQAHGEPFLTPVSPHVRVTATSDRTLEWATTGQRTSRNGRTSIFEANDVRDFVMTASPSYRTTRGKNIDGDTQIVVYTRTADGRRLLQLARQELARHERKFGIPYPYPTYRIAESGAGLPMEAPGLIWIPGFRGAADYPFLVSHETAHQWFYGIVGNDQSTNAFADEALADYFSRRARLTIRPSRCPLDRLDRDIRGYSTRCYFEVIYVQGAGFLDGIRRDFGGPAFLRAIQAYSADNRLGIGSNAKLLDAFHAEMGDRVLKRFERRFPSLFPLPEESPDPSPVAIASIEPVPAETTPAVPVPEETSSAQTPSPGATEAIFDQEPAA